MAMIRRVFLAALSMSCLGTTQAAPVEAREQLNALLWMQVAVEARGVTVQAYRLATARLDSVKRSTLSAAVEQSGQRGLGRLAPAIVLDIDETVLDNSPFNARLVRDGIGRFDATAWAQWVSAAEAKALDGARGFIQKARRLGFRIVYITNRECNRGGGYDAQGLALDCPQKAATVDNLRKALGYRVEGRDVLLRHERQGRDDTDKQARRLEVAKSHRIAMLVGDDLNDFIRRADYVAQTHAAQWGERWIALPNPVYGSWLAPYGSVDARLAALEPWTGGGPAPGSGPMSLRLTSWNMEWLADPRELDATGFWSTCAARDWPNEKLAPALPFCDVYQRDGILDAAAYAADKLEPLRIALAAMAQRGLDVLAVQEVRGPSALQAVLPPGYRVACFTTRDDAQNVGFAIREAAGVQSRCREVRTLSLEDDPQAGRPVRRGLELTLRIGDRDVALLNVHLKSGCPTSRLDKAGDAACTLLQRQAQPLEQWVEEQAGAGNAFIVVGDWNRDLELEVRSGFPARSDGSDPAGPIDVSQVRNLFPEINDGSPPASAIDVVVIDRAAASGRSCHANLDQIVVSRSLMALLDATQLPGGRIAAAMSKPPGKASDHCPIDTLLPFRQQP